MHDVGMPSITRCVHESKHRFRTSQPPRKKLMRENHGCCRTFMMSCGRRAYLDK